MATEVENKPLTAAAGEEEKKTEQPAAVAAEKKADDAAAPTAAAAAATAEGGDKKEGEAAAAGENHAAGGGDAGAGGDGAAAGSGTEQAAAAAPAKKEKEVKPTVHKANFEKDVVYLYQFTRTPLLPSMSPYCLKVETWLRLAGLKYEDTTPTAVLVMSSGVGSRTPAPKDGDDDDDGCPDTSPIPMSWNAYGHVYDMLKWSCLKVRVCRLSWWTEIRA
ncbi:hypothetical protein pipiens_008364 [Culex pipiens pipiens]|uniref:Uncharacterized protein n=1 Tax=Culex pipiens pipiens TaxID=38569 RepID=A0ABD1DJV8_CULPP